MLGAPVCGERAFDGGFEDGGALAFQFGPGMLQGCYGCVEAAELLFDGGYDTLLL